jgi:hypothetical protein
LIGNSDDASHMKLLGETRVIRSIMPFTFQLQ